jgi:hypothetical protein
MESRAFFQPGLRGGSEKCAMIVALDSACLVQVSSPIRQSLARRSGMPLLKSLALPDARQSDTARLVARGARRLLRHLNFATVTELPLLSGRRADIVALAMDATILIVEIKSSVADLRADIKWGDYRAHCDRLFFAIPDTVPIEIMPQDAGLILADAYGAEILRQAPEHRVAPATRRAVLLRFAQAAAHRLHRLSDPEVVAGGS